MILETEKYDEYWCDYINAVALFNITKKRWRSGSTSRDEERCITVTYED